MRTELGVCYYPEHWPQETWARDAKRMVDIGLSRVRIGEFAWSQIEPAPGHFNWAWLDRAVETLSSAGLGIVMGTPTATPPRWLIDQYPEILAWDRNERPRRFGSRRHYCFSSPIYRREAARITNAMGDRYGRHNGIIAWQTDNEYGCHDTVRSYSPAATKAFHSWLKEKYISVSALNEAWGNVFWSQEYSSFSDIDLPNLTVTEPNPSHVLDFYRFSSDQVVSFNRMQVEILRTHSPDREIIHNFMGFFFDFDHFAVGDDLDIVGWDSYPIGFLDVGTYSTKDKQRYLRQGHPDIAAFHHDLYRSCGKGRWQVLEQQPGPVNWAPNNPAPLSGMVRLWTLEAAAHGAEAVNYFRWRQSPFAQEQMHAGLERPDGEPAPATNEARIAAHELQKLDLNPKETAKAEAAILFSYDAQWLFEAQPQGSEWSYQQIVFDWYTAIRRLGLNVDFIRPGSSLDGYKLVLIPSLPVIDELTILELKTFSGEVLLGPRCGSKTSTLTIPDSLPPGPLQSLIPVKVSYSESFPAGFSVVGNMRGALVSGSTWLDHFDTDLVPIASGVDGPLAVRHGHITLLATVPDEALLTRLLEDMAENTGTSVYRLPPDLRLRQHGGFSFLFNYGPESQPWPTELSEGTGKLVLGSTPLPPASVAVWQTDATKG